MRAALLERSSALTESLRERLAPGAWRLARGARVLRRDLALYETLTRYVLFERYQHVFLVARDGVAVDLHPRHRATGAR